MFDQGDVCCDETLPVVVKFSLREDSASSLELHDAAGNYDSVYCWQAPSGMTESYFLDFLIEVVVAIALDKVTPQETQRFFDLLNSTPATLLELQKRNQIRKKWYESSDDKTTTILRKKLAGFEHIIEVFPSQGNISDVYLRINNETDPSGQLRKTINKSLQNEATFYAESDAEDENEVSQDVYQEDIYSSDEEEVEQEVHASPDKPCYYPSQIETAAILKKRIDTIMSHYHNISRLREAFNDIEFVVYTARYRMLSDQTEKRICHPDAGVLSKEELELRKGARDGKKRMFMYVRSTETDTHFDELKRDVQEKPQTLFVIVADECHWGITKDKEKKPSAHNLFINEWCKEKPPINVIVLQISATPFNLLTQNSRLPKVPCIILNEGVSNARKHYKAGDLVVLADEPELTEERNTSKKLELHVVHWSEGELNNFERGMRMKLRSSLKIEDSLYLHVSTEGKVGVTCEPEEATEFIIQGSHGIVILKVEQASDRTLTVTADAHGNLKADHQQPTEFEIKMDFGVGVVAFRSCDGRDRYISVDETDYVGLQTARIERKCGVTIMKPIHNLAKVSFQFYTDQSGPMQVNQVGKQYLSLNYYLSTLNSPSRKDQKIREDGTFQEIVDKAKRKRLTSLSDSPSFFPIDALLCADYCYHIILSSVFNSDDKICEALTRGVEESPAIEFHRRLRSFKSKLKETKKERYIKPEAFELIQRDIHDRVVQTFKENLKQAAKLWKQKSIKRDDSKSAMEELAKSIVACVMHLPPEEFHQLEQDTPLLDNLKQKLQGNHCRVMVQMWHGLIQEHETSSLVEDLIQSGKGDLGKMKIVRAKTMKTADQFYYTVQLARQVSGLEECFEVIRDYGGIQIKNQLMKSSSPFFKKLQPKSCTYKFDCCCSELKLQPRHKKCANCQHVHKSITQYEDLENLACILILVDKGRMGDTFPQSFDCLDLRLNYDSSQEFKEGSAMYLSSLIQELGRMCRYAKVSTTAIPYVLIGRQLFKKLQMSLETSPSMSATSCSKADRYMTKTRKTIDTKFSALRWLDYEAHKDSYDHENVQTHCNRILLQAEPQIGKTGTYLCLIRDLRLDILGKEKVMLASPSAFDDGIFYQCRENNYPDESILRERDERENWRFPYWKTIETSPSLYDKPVGTGKYSIGGCFYTHDTEKNPFILLKEEGRTLIKTGHQNPKTDDCSNGLRAWHWYHFEECAECGRLLQGRESILENVEINIDGKPVTVTCSLPSNCPSFTQLHEKLASGKSRENGLTLPYWIFHPSHRGDPRKCTLNYHHVMKEGGRIANYVQVVVVRREKFETYRSTWGKVIAILQLPENLANCGLAPDEGGIGYARLFIQKIAFSLELEYVFMIDDNVVMMSEAEFATDEMSGKERKVLRDDNGVMKMLRCTFLKPLTSLQKIAQGKEIPPMADEEHEPHPLKGDFEAQGFPLYTYSGPAKLFRDKQHGSYGILGLMRSIPRAVRPFAKTQVYAAVLLNVKSTVEKGVFYRPWPCWEDLRFNDDCDKAGLWVVKCHRYSFFKVQYKDWIENLVLPQVFSWDEKCSIVERPVESELPEALEEEIILEHLSSFLKTNGPDKCFKGRTEDVRMVDEEGEKSPLPILEKLDVGIVTEEDFIRGVSFLVISYHPENRRRDNLDLLDSNFCRTKEKIVFVASAKEVNKRWPQMNVQTISTKHGICHNDEMSDRKAQFAIFSAADPKRHRLRWILIEASFPQNDNKIKAETGSSNFEAFERNLQDTRNVLTLEGSLLSRLPTSGKTTEGRKRSLQESSDDCQTFRRQKIKDERLKQCGSKQGETKLCDDEAVKSERGGRSKSLGSVSEEEDLSSDRTYLSYFDGEGNVKVESTADASIVSEILHSQRKSQGDRNDYSKHIENTNDVTKVIVDLWMEYRKLPGSTKKLDQETETSDLTMEHVKTTLAQFTVTQLEERDKRGYNALLKACSLPSMSPHVMQYLINDVKMDVNSQLPHNFDRHHPAGEELIPGMSALSLAIKRGNVKSIQTFKKQGKEISVENSDEEGNTALHHCVLSCSKFAFEKLFPLYESKKWETMINREGKNPLDIAKKMESSGLTKGKQRSITSMITKMKEKNNSDHYQERVENEKVKNKNGTLEEEKPKDKKSNHVETSHDESNPCTVQIKRQKIGDFGQQLDFIPTTGFKEEKSHPAFSVKKVNEDGSVDAGTDSNFNNEGVKQDTSGKKADSVKPLDVTAHINGTNHVTGIIEDLWREYKVNKSAFEENGRNDFTEEEIHNKLQYFAKDQLEETDERGYNALLKASSLPSMSPRVMQYLITTRKVDLNRQLPSEFDVNQVTAKDLVPGMSSLSVAIRKGNIRSVSTFMSRSLEVNTRSFDLDGNSVLHHCVISISKSAFDKIFKLFKPLNWKEIRNKAGKNPLDICIEKEEELRQQKNKDTPLEKLRAMRKEMEKGSA